MYILRFILFLIILSILSCITQKPYWLNINQSYSFSKNSVKFLFYVEPNSHSETIKKIIPSLLDFIEILKTYPYLEIKESTYKFVIYKDQYSYQYYRPFKIESIAHYDRNQKIIHIPISINFDSLQQTIPNYVIYHEFIHAILEECCNNYPIWLNEGLALFLQNVQKPYNCGKNAIYLPPNLLQNKNFLIMNQVHLPYYPEFDKIYNIQQQNLISGLFVYYLFNTNQLLNYIQLINQHNEKLFFILTKGNLNLYKKECIKFYLWLIQIKENQYINGC